MIERCFLEITNICNLDCVFCPKNARAKRRLSMEEFDALTDRLRGNVHFLYFHLMGEPTLHPELPEFVRITRQKGFVPVLTTNGTLLSEMDALIPAAPYKINISLHSQEGNGFESARDYIDAVMKFAVKASDSGIIVVLRLWNQGGYDSQNNSILEMIAQYVPQPWTENRTGFKLADRLFLEYDRMFEWPDQERSGEYGDDLFCYGLRGQIGVLCDGTVVPCCLDHEGTIRLGNLFQQSLEEILKSDRAVRMFDGFSAHKAVEPLCRTCGYAQKTKRYRE